MSNRRNRKKARKIAQREARKATGTIRAGLDQFISGPVHVQFHDNEWDDHDHDREEKIRRFLEIKEKRAQKQSQFEEV